MQFLQVFRRDSKNIQKSGFCTHFKHISAFIHKHILTDSEVSFMFSNVGDTGDLKHRIRPKRKDRNLKLGMEVLGL